jgi:hypothetical protein
LSSKITITLPKPHVGQRSVINSQARFIVLLCGRRWGKSLISQVVSITEALQGKQVAYITPTYQLAKVFFDELIRLLPIEVADFNKSDLVVKLSTGGVIRFFTGERLDNLRGLKFHRVIIDEASFIPDLQEGWLKAIRPTLTDYKGKAIFLSTPRGKNFFYSLYLKGKQNEQGWESFKYTTYDNPFIDKSEIDMARNSLPEAVFNQEYLADPMDNAANPFGSEYIRKAIKPLSTKQPMYFGIDLAKSVDWTVIVGLDENCQVCYLQRFQKDWQATIDAILQLPNKPTLLDSTGVGDSVVEMLQAKRSNFYGFKYTSTSKQQIMKGLAVAIQQGTISYPEGVIADELESFEYVYTAGDGVRYSAPSGLHDDAVNALALARECYNKYKDLNNFDYDFVVV